MSFWELVARAQLLRVVGAQACFAWALPGVHCSSAWLHVVVASAGPTAARQVLVGWYRVPKRKNDPMEVVLNPQGDNIRSRIRIW